MKLPKVTIDKNYTTIAQVDRVKADIQEFRERYTCGDRDGGMIAHIRNIAKWYLTHDKFGHVKTEPETENAQTRLAAWLETFCKEDQKTA